MIDILDIDIEIIQKAYHIQSDDASSNLGINTLVRLALLAQTSASICSCEVIDT